MPGSKENCLTMIRMPVYLLSMVMAALFLQGCSGNLVMPITPEDRASLHTAPVIHVVHYEPSLFNIMTPKDAGGSGLFFGLVSDATDSTTLPSGVEMMRAFSLSPASVALENDVASKLKNEAGLSNVQVDPQSLKLPVLEDTKVYRSKYSSGLVLDIEADYGANYQVVHWKTYNFGIYGKARLIRVADGKVLWKDTCNINGHSDDSLTLDVSQFEANNGARLKKLTKLAADTCSRVLVKNLLGKDGE